MKNERKQEEKKQKKKRKFCYDIVCVCRDTISSRPKELCRNQQLNVATKLRQNSRLKEQFCHEKYYFCRNKQNMKEVDSLSLQGDEEKNKRSDDKEIHVAT